MGFQRPPSVRREPQSQPPQPRQRRYLRAAVEIAATYNVVGSSSPREGTVRDLGGGGLRLSTTEDLPAGADLLLRFRLPSDGGEVAGSARIVMSFRNGATQRFEHGLAFTKLDPARQAAIVQFVSELEPNQEIG